jgi:uncharacterized damage-inducible protein DinB
MTEQGELRKHLLELLNGGSAHIGLEDALSDFPLDRINEKPGSSPHSAWDLLEHIRLAHWDIVEFSKDGRHESPEWPSGYWPKKEGTSDEWKDALEKVFAGVKEMCDLVKDESNDLFAPIPHGGGQTLLREALLVADHNAYHIGQIMLVKKTFE